MGIYTIYSEEERIMEKLGTHTRQNPRCKMAFVYCFVWPRD